jgi:hypothetical protein
MQKSSDDESYCSKEGHENGNAQNPEVAAQQIRVLLDLYRRFGPISFDHGNIDEAMGELRRELQNPSVFAVSSLPMQAWWRLPEEKMELLTNAREAIVSEYERYHMLFEEEVINRDVEVANERRDFLVGEPVVFDDSFYHSVQVGSSVRRRLALVIDVWHPEVKSES